jgi:hypothetical protein
MTSVRSGRAAGYLRCPLITPLPAKMLIAYWRNVSGRPVGYTYGRP